MKALKFWTYHPALLYGLAVLLGTLFVLQSPLALLPLFVLLLHRKYVFLITLLFLLPIAYLYHIYTFPPSGTPLSGRFSIHSMREGSGFGKGWIYRGVFHTKQGRLYCSLYQKKELKASCAYSIYGRVYTQNGKYYSLQPYTLEAIPNSFSLAEKRYQSKKWVRGYIERHIKPSRAAHFLTGMVTGELEDRVMQQEFGQLGLSHIMAISGFHFALLTLAFHLFLRLFLPHKLEAGLLMVLLSLYLLFIGDAPSIQRAWIVAMVFLLGQLLEKPPNPLNSLGVAILLAVALNPLSATTLSFQLSFLATGGILLLYTPLNQLLRLWIPPLPIKKVMERLLLWQHGYVALAFLREALTLTLAVHLALIPLLIHFFHTFSLNSLFYNLFFPFCASVALFLFILGVVTGGILHPLCGWYCAHLLALTETPPVLFKTFYIESFSSLFLVLYITILFIIGAMYETSASHIEEK